METKIKELFAAILNVDADAINDSATPSSIDRWDSMQHLFLVSGFEEEFSIDIDPEEAVDMYKDFATFKKIVLSKL
ncbi:MAG TPA: acyl carrier protein [Thermodesulfobacteriota bacterium]|nr:acyl carrier protein [Thermodesulfobacteriota bacterium]